MNAETIFAVASGAGHTAIAVMRLSGPDSHSIVTALCGRVPAPRKLSLRHLRDIDQAMVVWLPGPGSYTGEDSAEFYLHGGRSVLAGIADALAELGARPAEPGEFTRRAFLNGRMDLTEAEAVHDLIAAETEAQRRQALRQLDGALGALYRRWADRLQLLLAQQEALIDFPDEDLPPEVEALVQAELAALHQEVFAHLNDNRRGERLREGLVFAITGAPNVGKSSLINVLAERDVAIVSAIPGTTRDALETRVVFGGVPVTLVDTAGLRDTSDEIEAEGVRRALARADAADVVIEVVEAAACGHSPPGPLPQRDREARPARPLVANKTDLGGIVPDDAIGISALTREGLDTFRARLANVARSLTESSGPPPLTQARHRAALQDAVARLAGAETADLPELRAEDLRLALRALGRITGTVGVEDILDTLFARFCIGK
jgi:tRNA modification GTPase